MSLRLPNSGSGSAAAAFKIATRALCDTKGNFDRNVCNLASFLGGSAIACSPSASTDQDVLERSGLRMRAKSTAHTKLNQNSYGRHFRVVMVPLMWFEKCCSTSRTSGHVALCCSTWTSTPCGHFYDCKRHMQCMDPRHRPQLTENTGSPLEAAARESKVPALSATRRVAPAFRTAEH